MDRPAAPLSQMLQQRMRRLPGSVIEQDDDALVLVGPAREVRLPASDAATAAVLAALDDWAAPETVFAAAVAATGPSGGAAATALLRACRAAGVLQEALFRGGAAVARARITLGSGLGPEAPVTPLSPPLVWVPGVKARPEDGGWHIAAPLAEGELWVAAGLMADPLSALSVGWTPVGGDDGPLDALLHGCGLVRPRADPAPVPALSPEGLDLHAASRRGSARLRVGATGRHLAHRAPPARRPAQDAMPLPRPGPLPPLALDRLLDARRSRRPGGEGAIAPEAEDLGALLWIAARDLAPPWRDDDGFERLARPTPSAGGCHEIDLYLSLSAPGPGLPAFSRYDAALHALVPLPGPATALLRDAGQAMGGPPPPALLTLAARFARIGWKYGAADYALILKNAGVLLQTLHLACTALDLPSCILGGGDNRHFARATGLDPAVEGPVGEIALGGRPQDTGHRKDVP